MKLPGLLTVKAQDTDTIDRLASMMGRSFLEEPWSKTLFSALDESDCTDTRKLEISRAIMRADFTVGSPFECVYMLPDFAAGAGGYLKSELGGRTWAQLEESAFKLVMENTLSENEIAILADQLGRMKHISNVEWVENETDGNDFIHFFSLGVAEEHRGTGAFRRLITPFLDFADEKGIACFLECYCDRLEGVYSHFDFETVQRFSDPAFDIVERCMVRRPQL